MISALFKAVAQLSDPRAAKTILTSLYVMAVLYGVLFIALWWGIGFVPMTGSPWLDRGLAFFGGAFGAGLLAFFLFPVMATACIGLFLDDIADAVEERHYPRLPSPRRQTLRQSLWSGFRFFGASILLNAAALLLSVFLPVFSPFFFLILNGYLISREYFELVALRRLDARRMAVLRKTHAVRLLILGVLLAAFLTIPFLNVFVPVVGIAAMVHMVYRMGALAFVSEHPKGEDA